MDAPAAPVAPAAAPSPAPAAAAALDELAARVGRAEVAAYVIAIAAGLAVVALLILTRDAPSAAKEG